MFFFDSDQVRFDSTIYEFTGFPEPVNLICGDVDALHAQVLALLPTGRAWQTSDPIAGGVLQSYWRSVAQTFAFVGQRLCDLHREFFCATRNETDPEWMEEYGLPDDCDPFADVCVKVAATGGSSCAYLAWIAERAGWSIDCHLPCGALAGCGEAGCDVAGSSAPNGTLYISVNLAESPSYTPLANTVEAGCYEAAQATRCDPLEPLRCLIERIAQAHLQIFYFIEA